MSKGIARIAADFQVRPAGTSSQRQVMISGNGWLAGRTVLPESAGAQQAGNSFSGTTLPAFHIVTLGNRIPAQWSSFKAVHFPAQVLAQLGIFPGKGISARFRYGRAGFSRYLRDYFRIFSLSGNGDGKQDKE